MNKLAQTSNNRMQLISPQQAMTILGVSSRTLQGWRTAGFGPKFIRVGRQVRYRMDEVEEWLLQNTEGGHQ